MASQKGLAVLAGSFILRGPIDEVCSSCSLLGSLGVSTCRQIIDGIGKDWLNLAKLCKPLFCSPTSRASSNRCGLSLWRCSKQGSYSNGEGRPGDLDQFKIATGLVLTIRFKEFLATLQHQFRLYQGLYLKACLRGCSGGGHRGGIMSEPVNDGPMKELAAQLEAGHCDRSAGAARSSTVIFPG